jgi:hypothetical protein
MYDLGQLTVNYRSTFTSKHGHWRTYRGDRALQVSGPLFRKAAREEKRIECWAISGSRWFPLQAASGMWVWAMVPGEVSFRDGFG